MEEERSQTVRVTQYNNAVQEGKPINKSVLWESFLRPGERTGFRVRFRREAACLFSEIL